LRIKQLDSGSSPGEVFGNAAIGEARSPDRRKEFFLNQGKFDDAALRRGMVINWLKL
jgi:hypothetical protein